MITRVIFAALLVLSLFIETTILPFPFFVLFSILYVLFLEDFLTFTIILFLSLFLDRMLLYTLGTTALFLFSYFCMVVLLEKIFTIKLSAWIIAGITIIGVEVYRNYIGYPFIWGLELTMMFGLLLLVYIEKRIIKQEGGAVYAKTKI